jgi:lipopolysaccharide/colanic/teichoic acid biosynthesis glycosyltransferase
MVLLGEKLTITPFLEQELLFDELVIDLRSAPATVSHEGETLELDTSSPSLTSRLPKRIFDVLGALTGLIVGFPILVTIGVWIFLSSPGPVVFKSQRLARNGQTFNMYKFRTMHRNAEELLEQLLANDEASRKEFARYVKLRNDPRITKIGGFLRRTNLDELPQLWNVLKGEMSLVGPRPKLPQEQLFFAESLDTILRVKPGLTGLWQTSGRNKLTIYERVMLDVEYATAHSFWLDLKLCFRTIKQMRRPRCNGAS